MSAVTAVNRRARQAEREKSLPQLTEGGRRQCKLEYGERSWVDLGSPQGSRVGPVSRGVGNSPREIGDPHRLVGGAHLVKGVEKVFQHGLFLTYMADAAGWSGQSRRLTEVFWMPRPVGLHRNWQLHWDSKTTVSGNREWGLRLLATWIQVGQ